MKRSFLGKNRRTGITLIEVVVAILLLGTLVSGMVLAYSAHHRQAVLANRRQEAIQAADRLLTHWFSSTDPDIPRNGQGILPGLSHAFWRTSVVHQNVLESLPVEIIRLQVFSGPSAASKSNQAHQPMAQVDVIVPVSENRL